MIIDASNYAAHRPEAGDELRNKAGQPVARVVRIRKSGALKVRSIMVPSLVYDLLQGIHWETWLEGGGQLHRKGDES